MHFVVIVLSRSSVFIEFCYYGIYEYNFGFVMQGLSAFLSYHILSSNSVNSFGSQLADSINLALPTPDRDSFIIFMLYWSNNKWYSAAKECLFFIVEKSADMRYNKTLNFD